MSEVIAVSLIHQEHILSFDFLDVIFLGLYVFFALLDHNLCFEERLAHYELPVAKFTNLASRLLTIGVDFSVRVHALLIETFLTVALSTELAK